jgi:hypothetical protein
LDRLLLEQRRDVDQHILIPAFEGRPSLFMSDQAERHKISAVLDTPRQHDITPSQPSAADSESQEECTTDAREECFPGTGAPFCPLTMTATTFRVAWIPPFRGNRSTARWTSCWRASWFDLGSVKVQSASWQGEIDECFFTDFLLNSKDDLQFGSKTMSYPRPKFQLTK